MIWVDLIIVVGTAHMNVVYLSELMITYLFPVLLRESNPWISMSTNSKGPLGKSIAFELMKRSCSHSNTVYTEFYRTVDVSSHIRLVVIARKGDVYSLFAGVIHESTMMCQL